MAQLAKAPYLKVNTQSVATLTVGVGEWGGGGLSLCVREDFKNWAQKKKHSMYGILNMKAWLKLNVQL